MKQKLLGIVAILAVAALFAAGAPRSPVAAHPFSEGFSVAFTSCTAAATTPATPCVSNGTVEAGEGVTTLVHTTLPTPDSAFYDAIRQVSTGITQTGTVLAGEIVGSGAFDILAQAPGVCTPATGNLHGAYTIYATQDTNATPPAGYAKGFNAAEAAAGWTAFEDDWIQDFDDDNNNNVPDFAEASPPAGNTFPQSTEDIVVGIAGDGIPDGAQREPLYLSVLDLLNGATHSTRYFGVADILGALEVPVDFVIYSDYPVGGQTTLIAVIQEGSALVPAILPSNPSGAGTQTCPPFLSEITIFDKSSTNKLVQKADASGSYQFEVSVVDDYDGDNVPNYEDNCDTVPNLTQTDGDGDGIGLGCDANDAVADAVDVDADLFPNNVDSCPYNKDAVDSDGDGVSNGCDTAPSVSGDGNGYPVPAPGVFHDHDTTNALTFTLPLANGTITGVETVLPKDSNDNHLLDAVEDGSSPAAVPHKTLGNGLKLGDSDGDGVLDGADADALAPGGRSGKCGTDCGHVMTVAGFASDSAIQNVYGDGCNDPEEATLSINFIPLTGTNPWEFYSVPVPALFAAPSPKTTFRNPGTLSGSGAQAVFGYFKQAAKLGTAVYDQDLNQNNVMDGVEYDRKVSGVGPTLGPDGVIAGADAQKAFSEFKQGPLLVPAQVKLQCTTGGYKMDDSTWYHGGTGGTP